MSYLKNTLRDNRWACWLALACLVVPMFASYFFDDMFSSLSELFKNPEYLELGWNMADYGFYASGYSFLCIWGGLIVCGALLDKFGVRLVGSIFVGMMVGGAALVTFAISAGFDPKVSLTIAYVGCMLFGLGSEIAGVSVTRSIAKWFKGRNMALAMGLQLAIARFGTATAILVAPMIVKQKVLGEMYTLAETNRPALIGLAVLAVGAVLWAVFVAMDARFDKETGETDKVDTAEEDKFRISDIWKVLSNPRFLMIALLCVTFYCCVIRFKKFGVSILLPLFGVDLDIATVLLAMIPFFTILFTPLFGALVDKVGKATLWMIVGSAFNKIVSSLVNDVIMPAVGSLLKFNVSEAKLILVEAVLDPETAEIITPAVALSYGKFIQAIIDFLIIAFSVFVIVKLITVIREKAESRAKKAEEEAKKIAEEEARKAAEALPAKEPEPTTNELLGEIINILRENK